MTLTLELPVEVENELREAASARGMAVEDYAVERLRFDEPKFGALLDSDPLAALDYLIDHTPQNAEPLADDAVARSYADYHEGKAAA